MEKNILLIIYAFIGVLVTLNIFSVLIKRRRSVNFYEQPDFLAFLTSLAGLVLTFSSYFKPPFFESQYLFVSFVLILFIFLLAFWVIRIYIFEKNVLVFNMGTNKLVDILIEVLEKYNLEFTVNRNQFETVISLGQKTLIKIKEDVVKKDKLHIKFVRFRQIYNYENIIRDIQENVNKNTDKVNRFRGFGEIFFNILIIFMVVTVILIQTDYIDLFKVKQKYHEYKTRNIERIYIQTNNKIGNTEDNINNYGGAAESEDYFFYLKDHLQLCRADKDFKNEVDLINKPSGTGISHLNVIDDWIFYRSGKELNRMKLDGSNNETIYSMGYTLDLHVMGNWIYFINVNDDFKIYKMDVNGQNLHALSGIVGVKDISIYENRIYYSYELNKQCYLESMNLNGQDTAFIANILAKDLIKDNNIIYYINAKDSKLYKLNIIGNKKPIGLTEEISRFCKVDNWIYYSGREADVYYPGAGLYKMDINGEHKEKINDDTRIEYLSNIGDWIVLLSAEDNKYPYLKRINIKGQAK